MLFEVQPAQIQALDQTTLVHALRRLLHAEAINAHIELRAVSVPLQITVPDGGEDGRISWTGGVPQTNYLPSRYCTFQSKASNLGPAEWKKETWAKASRRQGVARRLSTALATAITEQGSYIGFTSAALVGTKYDECIHAIRAGIQEAGGNPTDLTAIDIYDANKIASWCCQHPSVALWLNEQRSGLALRGFQTVDRWGTHPEYSVLQLVPDNAPRFALRTAAKVVAPGERQVAKTNSLNFSQAKERILNHLTESGCCVRLTGPSGVGKTRFVYEVLKDTSTIAKAVSVASAVYCDYRSLGQQQLLQVAEALVQERTPVLIVVDECPRDVSGMLGDIAVRQGSQLRIVTIDIDERP
jgi:hypothetical protein